MSSNLKRFEQIELQAKLLNYFLGSDKSNINQTLYNLKEHSIIGNSTISFRQKLDSHVKKLALIV